MRRNHLVGSSFSVCGQNTQRHTKTRISTFQSSVCVVAAIISKSAESMKVESALTAFAIVLFDVVSGYRISVLYKT